MKSKHSARRYHCRLCDFATHDYWEMQDHVCPPEDSNKGENDVTDINIRPRGSGGTNSHWDLSSPVDNIRHDL